MTLTNSQRQAWDLAAPLLDRIARAFGALGEYGYACSCGAHGSLLSRSLRDADVALHAAGCQGKVRLWPGPAIEPKKLTQDDAISIALDRYWSPSKCGCGHPNAMPPCHYCVDGWLEDVDDPELREAMQLDAAPTEVR